MCGHISSGGRATYPCLVALSRSDFGFGVVCVSTARSDVTFVANVNHSAALTCRIGDAPLPHFVTVRFNVLEVQSSRFTTSADPGWWGKRRNPQL